MTSYKTAFPSKYLKADDFPRPVLWVIARWEMEEIGRDDDKKEDRPVLYFNEADRGIVLNMTNADTIGQLYGEDFEGWMGKEIVIYKDRVRFGNKMVDGIRMRAPKQRAPAQPAPTAAPPAVPTRNTQHVVNEKDGYALSEMRGAEDDDIPF